MPEHSLLPALLDPRRRPDDAPDPAALKAELTRQGVNNRGWRLYADFGDALLAPLARTLVAPERPFAAARNAVDYLCLLQACEMDVPPPPGLAATLAAWDLPGGSLAAVPPGFFRAAWKAAMAAEYAGEETAAFAAREVVPLARWFFATGLHETAEPGLLKAGWPALCRRRDEWLARHSPPAAPMANGDDWDPYLRRVEFGGYVFMALTSAASLAEEGAVMEHCVGSYDDDCRAGEIRIFSVRERKSGQRVATLSVERVERETGMPSWEVGEINGPGNAGVTSRLEVAADAVVRSFADLPRSTFPKSHFLRHRVTEVADELELA
jgi:hypothetical protein